MDSTRPTLNGPFGSSHAPLKTCNLQQPELQLMPKEIRSRWMMTLSRLRKMISRKNWPTWARRSLLFCRSPPTSERCETGCSVTSRMRRSMLWLLAYGSIRRATKLRKLGFLSNRQGCRPPMCEKSFAGRGTLMGWLPLRLCRFPTMSTGLRRRCCEIRQRRRLVRHLQARSSGPKRRRHQGGLRPHPRGRNPAARLLLRAEFADTRGNRQIGGGSFP